MSKAILLTKDTAGQVRSAVVDLDSPEYQTTLAATNNAGYLDIQVEYSSINYKDALAVSGKPGVIRNYPLIPGIDLTGTVLQSDSAEISVGEKITVNGWGIGENFNGGYTSLAKVRPEWITKLPATISTFSAAAFGTAGYTAALAVNTIYKSVPPQSGEIIVTGGNGGVGGYALGLLSRLGYQTVAATSRLEQAEYLQQLGANQVIPLAELNQQTKPLQSERWAAAVDVLGGQSLVNILAQAKHSARITCSGLAESASINGTVMPFILRAVSLIGINSVYASKTERDEAWQLLAANQDLLQSMQISTVALDQVQEVSSKLLDRQLVGRYVVKL